MKQVIGLIAFSFLASCGPALTEKSTFEPTREQLAAAKQAAAYDLKDPGSAQFRNIRGIQATAETGKSATYICGEVNGKNAFGGYVGFTPFVYSIKDRTARIANRSSDGVNLFDQAAFEQYC